MAENNCDDILNASNNIRDSLTKVATMGQWLHAASKKLSDQQGHLENFLDAQFKLMSFPELAEFHMIMSNYQNQTDAAEQMALLRKSADIIINLNEKMTAGVQDLVEQQEFLEGILRIRNMAEDTSEEEDADVVMDSNGSVNGDEDGDDEEEEDDDDLYADTDSNDEEADEEVAEEVAEGADEDKEGNVA